MQPPSLQVSVNNYSTQSEPAGGAKTWQGIGIEGRKGQVRRQAVQPVGGLGQEAGGSNQQARVPVRLGGSV